MLTAGQIAHFDTFGFLVLRQLFTPEEAAIMKREAIEIFDEARGVGPFTGEKWEQIQPFFEQRPFSSALPDDDRVYNIGVDLLGPDFFLGTTEGSLHVGDTGWHGGPPPEHELGHVKIAFYLDALTRETGCLRVIPGSHLPQTPYPFEMLRNRAKAGPEFRPFGMLPSELPSVALECKPGDVVAFKENTLHASFGGAPGRHQHAVVFFENPKTEAQEAYIRGLYEKMKYSFHPARSYIDSDRPRIRRMVSRLVEWGFEPIEV
jgi:hypothetical protein